MKRGVPTVKQGSQSGTTALQPYPAYKDSGVEWLGEVPEHWEVRRLKNICRLNYGDSLGSNIRSDGDIAVFGSNGQIGWHDAANAEAPCLVVGRKGSFGKVNYAADPVFAIDTTFFVDERSSTADIRWLYYGLAWLRLDEVTKDSAVPGLDRQDAYTRRLAMPPRSEQTAIARFLDHADRRIRRYIRAKGRLIELLEEQKQASIHQAVTGQIDVRTGQPYPAYKDSGVEWLGEMPEHWEVVALKRVLDRLVDCEHKTAPAVDESEYRVVRTTAVRGGKLRWEGTYCTSEQTFLDWTKRCKPEPGDVIFTREAPVGEACVVPAGTQVCLGQRTVLMRPMRGEYDPEFLVHMIYGGPPRNHVRLATQGTTVGHFNMEDIGALRVFKPPLSEQRTLVREIARQTRELDLAVAGTERQVGLLDEYRTRLVADVVTGKLDVREAAARLPEVAPIAGGGRVDATQSESKAPATEYGAAREAGA